MRLKILFNFQVPFKNLTWAVWTPSEISCSPLRRTVSHMKTTCGHYEFQRISVCPLVKHSAHIDFQWANNEILRNSRSLLKRVWIATVALKAASWILRSQLWSHEVQLWSHEAHLWSHEMQLWSHEMQLWTQAASCDFVRRSMDSRSPPVESTHANLDSMVSLDAS